MVHFCLFIRKRCRAPVSCEYIYFSFLQRENGREKDESLILFCFLAVENNEILIRFLDSRSNKQQFNHYLNDAQ